MKSLLLLLVTVFIGLVTSQTVSPCITLCVTQYCPKGVTDTPCFCVSEHSLIEQCIQGSCSAPALQQWGNLEPQFCNGPRCENTLIFVGGTTTSSSSSTTESTSSSTGSTAGSASTTESTTTSSTGSIL